MIFLISLAIWFIGMPIFAYFYGRASEGKNSDVIMECLLWPIIVFLACALWILEFLNDIYDKGAKDGEAKRAKNKIT